MILTTNNSLDKTKYIIIGWNNKAQDQKAVLCEVPSRVGKIWQAKEKTGRIFFDESVVSCR